MKIKRLTISCMALAIITMFAVSCYYDSEEALYPSLSTNCDTANVTYSGTIAPMINSNCIGCHGGSLPSGGISLKSYEDVKVVASNGSLMNALNGNGVPRMPPSGPLPGCKINQVDIWIKNGMPNN